MAFKKGESGNPNGRPKGTLSEAQRVKADILECYRKELGGRDFLILCAKKDPVAVMGLIVKLLPKEIELDLVEPIRVVYVSPDEPGNDGE